MKHTTLYTLVYSILITYYAAAMHSNDYYNKQSKEAWKQVNNRCAQAQFAMAQASRQQVSPQVIQQITDPCTRAQAEIHNNQVAWQQKKQ